MYVSAKYSGPLPEPEVLFAKVEDEAIESELEALKT